MVGIDAPERGHPARPKEFGADEAAEALSSMCLGKTVRLEKGFEEDDRHGRMLRFVFSADGHRLYNLELVRGGFARVYRRFPFPRLGEFEEAEAGARREGLGVWRDRGLDELRWARSRGVGPVSVWALGGGEYGIVLRGMGKAGLRPESLQSEIAKLAGMSAALSDAEFAAEARMAGFGELGETDAPGAAGPVAVRVARPASPEEGTVPWEKAHEFVGRSITVEGTVLRAKRSGRTVFLNFHGNWKRYLTVVLFTGRVAGLPADPVSFYGGRKIRVRGEVRRYKDRPEIVVESADDIRIVP